VRYFLTSVPTHWGEKIAVEIQPEDLPAEVPLGRLGFEKDGLDAFRQAIRRRHGLVIIAGPPESGRKTTIYAALAELNRAKVSIATAEWYLRRKLKGIQQTVVSDEGGLDQETVTETLLKSDVDVLYVQECGYPDIARIVVRAALGRKLILAEIRAEDGPHALLRLANMLIERWKICDAVLLINAQRLLRRLCPACREELTVNEKTLLGAGLTPDQVAAARIYRPVGCEACQGTGYHGRVLVCETMPFTEELKTAFTAGASSRDLKKLAVQGGLSTLRMSGLRKTLAGLTTLDEVLLNTPSDRS
jgi:type IV pilus assembly protein PilB